MVRLSLCCDTCAKVKGGAYWPGMQDHEFHGSLLVFAWDQVGVRCWEPADGDEDRVRQPAWRRGGVPDVECRPRRQRKDGWSKGKSSPSFFITKH